MLQLQVASNDVSNGNLAVAWCVDAETLKTLADLNISDPQVVIITAPTEHYHHSKEYRKIVPLKDLMTYVEFKSSGPNKIWAFISVRKPKETKNRYLRRENGVFYTDLLQVDGSDFIEKHDVWDAPAVSVEVPQGAFAAEPPQWEKEWVNFWFRQKPQDQCEYRRRRLLAYTVQPVAFFLLMFIRTMMLLFASLYLSRGMTLKYIVHIMRYDMDDTLDVFLGGSWAIAHLPEDDKSSDPDLTFSYVFRKLWKVSLTPAFLVPMWLAYYFHVMIAVIIILTILTVVVSLALVFSSGFVGGVMGKLLDRIAIWLDKKQAAAPWYMDKEEIDAITCAPGMKARTSVSALPAKHRTLRLRLESIKSKVCRPFSA
jgi:hypothetical protein